MLILSDGNLIPFLLSSIIRYSGLVIFGISFYLAINQLIIFIKDRSKKASLWFSLSSFGFGLYALGDFIFLASSDNFPIVYIINNVQFALLVASILMSYLFITNLLENRNRTISLIILLSLAVFMEVLIISGNLFTNVPEYRVIKNALFNIVYPNPHATWALIPFITLLYVAIFFIFIRFIYHYRKGKTHFKPLVIGFGLMAVFGVNDALTLTGMYPFSESINLFTFGVFSVNMSMAITLANILILEKQATQQKVIDTLRSIDAMKDEFLANTSHELRTPLNGIIGIAESIVNDTSNSLDKETTANLSLIVSSGQRLSYLINDILDFSKLKNNQLKLSIQPLELNTIVNGVITISNILKGSKPVSIKNLIPPNQIYVMGDENRLQQILFNLLGNAIKFTITGSITITAKPSETHYEICVKDTGVGIRKEHIDKVFIRFEQMETSYNTWSAWNDKSLNSSLGTGLGLSVTKKLIELQKGTIWVVSEYGQGSEFYFTIPKADIGDNNLPAYEITNQITNEITNETTNEITKNPGFEQPLESPIQNSNIELPTESRLTEKKTIPSSQNTLFPAKQIKKQVLIIDDETVNVKIISNCLKIIHAEGVVAYNGTDALTILKNNSMQFDLVLLDVMMPGASGFEVCKEIRSMYSLNELPIILLTARNSVSDHITGLELGANDFITKPFNTSELLARIKTQLHIAELHKQVIILNSEYKQITTRVHNSIKNKLEAVKNYMQHISPEVFIKEQDLLSIERLISHCSNECNAILFNVKHPKCTIEQLIKEIKFRAYLIFSINEIDYTVSETLNTPDLILSSAYTHALLEISIEMINNAIKHANPSLVEILVHQTEHSIVLQCKDDGIGFDVNLAKQNNSFGLSIIEDILLEIQGKLEIKSKMNAYTHIQISIPLTNNTENHTYLSVN